MQNSIFYQINKLLFMDDKSMQTSKPHRKRSYTLKVNKFDKFISSNPSVFYLPDHSPILQGQPKNTRIPRDTNNKGNLSSKSIQEKKNDSSLNMHQTLPCNQKRKKQKFYLWSNSPSKNEQKQLEYFLNYRPRENKGQNQEENKIRKMESNFMNTHNRFNLTTLSKREEMARTMRVKEMRERERKVLEKSFLPDEIVNTPQIWSCNKSRSTFYPSKNLSFKTFNILQQTCKTSKGGVYSKYYLKKNIIEPSELQITRAHFSDRKDQQKIEALQKTIIASSPYNHKKAVLVINEALKQKKKGKESRQILRGSQIKGWEIDEQALS